MNKIVKYIISIAIISLIIITLLELLIMPIYVRHGKNQDLVDVRSMEIEAAMIMLKTSGFTGVVTDTIFTSEFDPNIVLDQYPDPGSIVKKGRTVKLKISQVEKLVKVPYIIGQSQRSASLELNKAGLKIGGIIHKYNPTFPPGVIVAQSPDSSEILAKGYGVRIVISKGGSPDNIQVPNLFGLSKDAAELELRKIGLSLGKVHYQQNEELIPFTVLDQSIQAGTITDYSQRLDITVSVLNLDDVFQDVVD